MKWFHGFFSIDEFRISSLVLILIAVVAVILAVYATTGNVNHILISFAETLVYSVAGVNVVSGFTTAIDKRKNSKNDQSAIDRSSPLESNGTYVSKEEVDIKDKERSKVK